MAGGELSDAATLYVYCRSVALDGAVRRPRGAGAYAWRRVQGTDRRQRERIRPVAESHRRHATGGGRMLDVLRSRELRSEGGAGAGTGIVTREHRGRRRR